MISKQIVISSDHAGVSLKQYIREHLEKKGFKVVDVGPDSTASVDYPLYARIVCERVLAAQDILGILICGTGIGMSIAANRFKGIRAAVCLNEYHARMSREHNNANVLCLGERVVGPGLALGLVDAFVEFEFEGGRHQRRLDLIDNL